MSEPSPPTEDQKKQPGLSRRVVKNTGLIAAGKGLGGVAGLLYLALVGQTVGAAGLGIVLLIHSYVVLLGELVTFKSWQSVIRYGADDLTHKRDSSFKRLVKFTVALDLGSGALGAALGILLLPFVGPKIGLPDEVMPYAIAYCVTILLSMKSSGVGVLRLFDRFDLLALHALVVPAVRTLGVAAAWYADAPVEVFVIVWMLARAISDFIMMALGWIELYRHGYGDFPIPPLAGVAKEHEGIWRFAFTTNLNATVKLGSGHLATLAIGALLGPAGAALVKVPIQIANVLIKGSQLLNNVLYPELAKLISTRELGKLLRVVTRGSLIVTTIAVVYVGAMIAVGEFLLVEFFGPEFVESYFLLILFAIAAGIHTAGFVVEPTLLTLGRPDVPLKVQVLSTVVHFSLLVYLAKTIGLHGPAYAAVASSILTIGLGGMICWRLLMKEARPAQA